LGVAAAIVEYAARQGRSLSFYGNVLVGIALAQVLFAVMAGSPSLVILSLDSWN